MAKRGKKVRDLIPNECANDVNDVVCRGWNIDKYDEYKALLMNAIKIPELPFAVERFVKSELIDGNYVGYDKLTGKWARAFGSGLNAMWLPTDVTFVFGNGRSYKRDISYDDNPTGAYLICGLPTGACYGDIIKGECDILQACDVAIRQNLKASHTPLIVTVKDEDTRLSVLQAISQKEEGKPAVVVSPDVMEGIKGVKLETDFIVDKVEEYRNIHRDRLLNKISTMTANVNKRERVQVGEVNATVGQCEDYVYTLIDTFNTQMETYGIPVHMVSNSSLEELYYNNGTTANEGDEYV